jgi:D-tyrosyl-tRNA(Tyr) deacylase
MQRVAQAKVEVDGKVIGEIGRGLLVLVGVQKHDDTQTAKRLMDRLSGYRVFADSEGKMNLSVRDINGGLLLVPQFTLAADTKKGMRPSFSSAATPADGQRLFDELVSIARQQHHDVATGQFGADMQVSLTNDGPVTFIITV